MKGRIPYSEICELQNYSENRHFSVQVLFFVLVLIGRHK